MPFFDEDDRADLWARIPGIEFADFGQLEDIERLFNEFLEDVETYHLRPQDSDAWREMIDYLGLDEGDFPWDSFREWYENAVA